MKITNISYFFGCCHKIHDKKWVKEEVFILTWRQQIIRAGSHVSRHLRNIEFTCRALWSRLLLLYRISTHGMLPVTIKLIFFNFNLPGLICVFIAVIKHWPNTWIWNALFHITILHHNESLRVSKARTQYRNMGKELKLRLWRNRPHWFYPSWIASLAFLYNPTSTIHEYHLQQ